MSSPVSGPAPNSMTAPEILEREFLTLRAKLLEVAAAFDRLDRAEGSVAGDARRKKLHKALDILASKDVNRAEQLQLLFSLPYKPSWQQTFDLPASAANNKKSNGRA